MIEENCLGLNSERQDITLFPTILDFPKSFRVLWILVKDLILLNRSESGFPYQ